MGIKHFKASETSPESKSAVKVNDALTISTFDRQLHAAAGARRLMPCVFDVKKAKPYTYTTLGPSALYVIEGEFTAEEQSTGSSITYTKGDVAVLDEPTVLTCSSPSKARLFAVGNYEAPDVVTDGCS